MTNDPLEIIDELEPLRRETLRGMVATLVTDGFADDQARDIVAALFRSQYRADSSRGESV